jgi:hypothetical protein
MATRSRSTATIILIVGRLLVAGAAYAGPSAVPDYEVKFFLDPAKVLVNLSEPATEVNKAVGLSSSVTKLRMLFLDSKNHDLSKNHVLNEVGWNVRLRTIEDEDGIELVYKKRFRIGDRPLSQILEQAASEGFGADDTNYRAQVEWGSRRTLSFTRKKTVQVKGVKGMELPKEADARRVAVAEIAGKLDRARPGGWARGILAEAHAFGPVKGRRWSGKLDGLKLDFEVWDVLMADGKGTEPIVELSFKEDDEAKAESGHTKLENFLKAKGWLLKGDVLKTELILQRY